MRNGMMVVLVIISLLAGVYGIAQEAAAQKAQVQAEQNLILAEQARKEADANAAEAQKQAELARQEAERARTIQEQLEKCCKGKK